MKLVKGTPVVLALLALVGLVLTALIGYGVGRDQRALDCEEGDVLSLKVTNADDKGNGEYMVRLGDCERLSDDAFVAVVEALVGRATTTTTTTTTKAPTSEPKAAS